MEGEHEVTEYSIWGKERDKSKGGDIMIVGAIMGLM